MTHPAVRPRRSSTVWWALPLVALLGSLFAIVPPTQDPVGANGHPLDPYDGRVTRSDGVEGQVPSQANAVIGAEVWDIEFIGNTAFVGGKFLRTVEATTDWERHDQPFLAAFDGSTGQWISTFRPQLNGSVWALDQTPDGQLLVGGEFTTVNGEPHQGLVALNPATGAVDPTFTGQVTRPWSSRLAVVRDMEIRGDDLYVVGNFSRAIGAGVEVNVGKATRMNVHTGEPDPNWRPQLASRSGWAVAVSTDGQRVHLGGEFSSVNGTPGTNLYATVDSATGALVPGHDHGHHGLTHPVWPYGGITYDLEVVGDVVYVTGAEHFWERRDSHTGQTIQLVTSWRGRWFNDTQVVELLGDRIYIGCHCVRHHGYANHDVNAATGQILGSMTDDIQAGEGVWAAAIAPDQCVWLGGDLRGSTRVVGKPDGPVHWVGRFARFCPTDGPAPLPGEPTELIGHTDVWAYRAESSWPVGWEQSDFDDAVWPRGSAELGYGDGDEATVVSDAHRPAAVLARSTFTIDDPNEVNHLEMHLLADDGATVWINGEPRAALRMQNGTLTADRLATASVWGTEERTPVRLLLDADDLTAGENHIAVSVHQGWAGSTDLSFSMQLLAKHEPPDAAPVDRPRLFVEGQDDDRLVRANTDPVRFLQAEGPAPEGWTDVGFDDDSWTLGSGPAGFGEAGVSFELPQGRTTYYLRSTFDVTADQIGDGAATIELMFDDGVVVHINGTPVFRDNLPNVVHHMTRAEEFRWGELESRLWNNGINPGVLVAGENVLAIEVHQAHPDSRDLMASVSIRLNG